MTLAMKGFVAGAMIALAGCSAPSAPQATHTDPATGLPRCSTRDGLLPSSGNRIVQTPNSLPPGAKDLSASCTQGSGRPYLTQ